MRRFLIDAASIQGNRACISGSDVRHLRDVLRLQPGQTIVLLDGSGRQWQASIEAVEADRITAHIESAIETSTESPVSITVAQALLKDKKMDTLVRQVTELGAYRWVPFMAQRSVARPEPSRFAARRQRWEKIVLESLKQCRRSVAPEIGELLSYQGMLDMAPAMDLNIIFWEQDAPALDDLRPVSGILPSRILIVLGPEGGFSTEEVDAAKRAGFATATLGPRVLKAETATIAACSLVQFLFGDMGKNFLTNQAASHR